jgi:ABC-type multidrug transport system permease subunit
VFWTFFFPVVLAIGLGIAFRNKPADVLTVSVVRGTSEADTLAARLARAGGLRVQMLGATDAARALRTGEVALVATARGTAGVEYAFDDTRPEGRTARFLVDDAVQRAAGRRDPVAAAERKVREKGSRYIDFVIPGLLGMNIMAGGIWGLGFAIVEARRRNLLKRLVSTPMSRANYLASFLFSRFVFLLVEVVVILGSAVLLFGVPVRGSLLQLAVVSIVSALAFGGVGLLIASRAKTTEGVSGLMNLVMMPMWVLSGVFFSSTNFPAAAQPFIQALPLTATINALRSTMLQGVGWSAVTVPVLIVGVWGVLAFGVALKVFRWR